MLIERNANYTDIDFIYSTVLNGARHGHYSVNADDSVMKQLLKDEIHSITRRRCLLDGRYAAASIFTQQDMRVALLIISEAIDAPDAFEIYALSVASKYRGQGYGKDVLDQLLKRHYLSHIMARCSEHSIVMQRLLESRNFKPIGRSNGFTVLSHEVPIESYQHHRTPVTIIHDTISPFSPS